MHTLIIVGFHLEIFCLGYVRWRRGHGNITCTSIYHNNVLPEPSLSLSLSLSLSPSLSLSHSLSLSLSLSLSFSLSLLSLIPTGRNPDYAQFLCLKHNPYYCLYLLICLQEEAQGFIQQQILKEFGFVDVAIEDATVDCPFKSKRFGIFTATLRGNRARQLSTLIKSKGISGFTLKSGQSVTLEVCTNGCSQVESTARKPWISKAGGVVIAVTVIAVMLAGLALLIVILVCYRR